MNDQLESYQSGVWSWCKQTFDGIVDWESDKERAYRFFEEAGELFQAMGMTKEDAYKVVDYVFDRPEGELTQEIGGVMVTLLALAAQQRVSVAQSLFNEYARIIQRDTQEKIRAKQIAKKQANL